MTQTSLEDACKLKSFFSLQHLLKRMRSWIWGWKDVYKMTNTFHTRVIPQGRTNKCYFMTQGPYYKKLGMWGPRQSWILSFHLYWSRFCSKIPWLKLIIFFFLSTNVCWNKIWTLEIVLSPVSGFAQKSATSNLAQDRTKSQKDLAP